MTGALGVWDVLVDPSSRSGIFPMERELLMLGGLSRLLPDLVLTDDPAAALVVVPSETRGRAPAAGVLVVFVAESLTTTGPSGKQKRSGNFKIFGVFFFF